MILKATPKPLSTAFTRIDASVLLGIISLLMLTAAGLLGKTHSGAHRAVCSNNLRQIGVAMHQFGADHNNRPPMFATGADRGSVGGPTVYHQMLPLFNYLQTARIMVCPSDIEKQPVDDFSALDTKSVGYALPTEIDLYHSSSPLALDRLIDGRREFSTCSGPYLYSGTIRYPVRNFKVRIGVEPLPFWLPQLHGDGIGNILFGDGKVISGDSTKLRHAYFFNYIDGNKSGCTLMP